MKFEIKGNKFFCDEKEIKIISGAVHYFRNMPDTWSDILKKLRALGCNCVETYCAWNMHEPKLGQFEFGGILNIAEFIKKAQQEGIMVIVRPGPYICAEWEFGGLPWWIQTMEGMEIRSSNSVYMERFEIYLSKLFEEIKPLLFTNGGPIIMMQCENEYGSYGDDKKYLAHLYDFYRAQGIDVPLFTSDGTAAEQLLDGHIEGCFPTVNFGSRVEENFREHDKLFPFSPKMCMEMWNGWFDAWGAEKHITTRADDYACVVRDMIKKGSFNMYMFIGGTNFGFYNGANHNDSIGYAPTVTSYDYDALLTECGDITPKYRTVREIIMEYTNENPPEIPPDREKKAYGKVSLSQGAGLFENLSNLAEEIDSVVPKCMEEYGVGYGYIAYRTRLNRDYTDSVLSFEDIGDRAQIYINNNLVGIVYVNDESLSLIFSAKEGDILTILCENMGRTNFGYKMMRKKGIVGRCLLNGKIHFNWKVYPLPMDNLENVKFNDSLPCQASAFYRGVFEADEIKDTFLRFDNLKKGFVTVNGFNIGRYWEKGPQKTLYVPASLLKKGENEIIVFESDGIKAAAEINLTDKYDLG